MLFPSPSMWKMVKDTPNHVTVNMIGLAQTSHKIFKNGDVPIFPVVLNTPYPLQYSVLTIIVIVPVSQYATSAGRLIKYVYDRTFSASVLHLDPQSSRHWVIFPWISYCTKVGSVTCKLAYEYINITYLDTIYRYINSIFVYLQWDTSFPILWRYGVLHKKFQTHWHIPNHKINIIPRNTRNYMNLSRNITGTFLKHMYQRVFRLIIFLCNTDCLTINVVTPSHQIK